jgi:hypothetical protein
LSLILTFFTVIFAKIGKNIGKFLEMTFMKQNIERALLVAVSIAAVLFLAWAVMNKSTFSLSLDEAGARQSATFNLDQSAQYVLAVEFKGVQNAQLKAFAAAPMKLAITLTGDDAHSIYDETVTMSGISLQNEGKIYREISRLFLTDGKYELGVTVVDRLGILKEYSPTLKVMKVAQ